MVRTRMVVSVGLAKHEYEEREDHEAQSVVNASQQKMSVTCR